MKDLHLLPKVRDSWSYLYVDQCRVDKEDNAIAFQDVTGKVPVPCAALMLLMLGPGTTITHAAIRALADNGCLVVWTGEQGVRMYAQGLGETRSSRHLMKQAELWADPESRLRTVRRLYDMRFAESVDAALTLQQIRGMEGVRVRDAYAAAAKEFGVEWKGREYKRQDWRSASPINRALSTANSCLYGVCHAAIVSAGYSPALGFIHTGKMLSFVYDVADLYKTDVTVPVAFRSVAEGTASLEATIRLNLRDRFAETRLLSKVVDDLAVIFDESLDDLHDSVLDTDDAHPGGLWDPAGEAAGGVNWAEPQDPLKEEN